jgi:hypothetical protein
LINLVELPDEYPVLLVFLFFLLLLLFLFLLFLGLLPGHHPDQRRRELL